MALPKAFQGVVPPVVTPLTTDFKIDYPSFTRVIENLIDGGVHGLFILGSTSEVIFHDEKTRRAILDHAVKVNNGRLPTSQDIARIAVIKHAHTLRAIWQIRGIPSTAWELHAGGVHNVASAHSC